MVMSRAADPGWHSRRLGRLGLSVVGGLRARYIGE